MPRYTYRCESCKETFQDFHLISETRDVCKICGTEECLTRVPQIVGSVRSTNNIGNKVKNFIEEAKQEVKEEKERLDRERKK